MVDEPSNAELGRRLDGISRNLQALIGRPEYDANQRAFEHRLNELTHDLDDVRHQQAADTREIYEAIAEQARQTAAHSQWKTLIYVGLIPSLVAAAGILITIWFHGSGK